MAECLYELPVPIVFVVRYNEVVHICSPCIGVVTIRAAMFGGICQS